MKRLFTCLVAVSVLASCASDIMGSYVGKSITEPMMDYGRPADVFDLGGGRRAFQWSINSSGFMPITTPSYGTIYGSNGWASVTTNSTSYMPYSQNCLYTLTASQKGNDWIVDGYRKPTMMCE